MRLIKLNDVIVNLDKIKLIKGESSCGDKKVSIYIDNIYIGQCKSVEDYRVWLQSLYEIIQSDYPAEVVSEKEKEFYIK